MIPHLGYRANRLVIFAVRGVVFGIIMLIPLVAYVATLHATGNFHTVVDGQLYRSAQPEKERLAGYLRDYGIRTVVNLRGAHPGATWYEYERNAAADAGVRLIDFGISASEILEDNRRSEILRILREAAKPILIHCKAGSDRTGLISLLYAYEVAGLDEEVAEDQLSLFFGHFGIPYLSPTYAMDETWELREAALGLHGS